MTYFLLNLKRTSAQLTTILFAARFFARMINSFYSNRLNPVRPMQGSLEVLTRDDLRDPVGHCYCFIIMAQAKSAKQSKIANHSSVSKLIFFHGKN